MCIIRHWNNKYCRRICVTLDWSKWPKQKPAYHRCEASDPGIESQVCRTESMNVHNAAILSHNTTFSVRGSECNPWHVRSTKHVRFSEFERQGTWKRGNSNPSPFLAISLLQQRSHNHSLHQLWKRFHFIQRFKWDWESSSRPTF